MTDATQRAWRRRSSAEMKRGELIEIERRPCETTNMAGPISPWRVSSSDGSQHTTVTQL
jgi:hypothetical protein